MTRVFRILLLPLSLACVAPGVAQSQSPSVEDYEAVVARGVREFKHGYWAEALAAIRTAHELQPSARTLRGMGLSMFEMRRYAEAANMMTQALAQKAGVGELTDEQRESLEQARREALSYTAILEVETDPPTPRSISTGSWQRGPICALTRAVTSCVRRPGACSKRSV